MSKGFKFFLTVFISLPFWWGVNVLEKNLQDIFFWQEMARNPEFLAAQTNPQPYPLKKGTAEELKLEAVSAISLYVGKACLPVGKACLPVGRAKEKILFEKDPDKRLAIASLTKLMTAYTVIKNYDPDEFVGISREAVDQDTDFGQLRPGEKLRAKDLLYISLIESSNDAAYALAEMVREGETGGKERVEAFVNLMNLEAQNGLGLENTAFVNSTGLDPDNPGEPLNYSSSRDLTKIMANLAKQPLLKEIISLSEFELYSSEGTLHHRLGNTNEFLKKDDTGQISWRSDVIGGKTGWTPTAKGCLVLLLKAPAGSGYLINVILGSEDRTGEMIKLSDWVHESYKW